MKENKRGARRLDYKWVVVAACFLMVFTALGFCSSPKSLFIAPITEALGIKRSVFSFNDSLRYISTAVVNIFFGVLIARFGARRLIAAGFLALIGSALCYATATNVALIYLGGILLGVGLSWCTTTMVGFVVNRWCRENKGTVMGLVLASNGLGGALATQIVSPIIESGATQTALLPAVFGGSVLGYQKAYLLVALILLCVGTAVVILFREQPKNLLPTVDTPHKKGRGQSWSGIEASKALGKAWFWVACVCVFFTGLTLNGITGIAAAHMKDVGIAPAFVATVLSIHSLSLAAFKFITGFIYDKFGLHVTVASCTVAAVVVMILLALVSSSALGMAFAVAYGILSALALPLETVMLPIYASDFFGDKSFDKMLGIFVSINTAGYAMGALAMNLCYDLTGSYQIVLFACAALMLVIVAALQLVIRAAHRSREAVLAKERGAEN